MPVIMLLLGILIGYLICNVFVVSEQETIRKNDMQFAQRIINEQYKRGYEDGIKHERSKINDTTRAT